MAYMSQDKKKSIAASLKNVVPKSWKYSLSVRNHSTLVFLLKSSPVDFAKAQAEYAEKGSMADWQRQEARRDNTYFGITLGWMDVHWAYLSAADKATIRSIFDVLNDGNHDRSDIQTDYFDVGWYVDFKIGAWDKPYVLSA